MRALSQFVLPIVRRAKPAVDAGAKRAFRATRFPRPVEVDTLAGVARSLMHSDPNLAAGMFDRSRDLNDKGGRKLEALEDQLNVGNALLKKGIIDEAGYHFESVKHQAEQLEISYDIDWFLSQACSKLGRIDMLLGLFDSALETLELAQCHTLSLMMSEPDNDSYRNIYATNTSAKTKVYRDNDDEKSANTELIRAMAFLPFNTVQYRDIRDIYLQK